MLNHSGKINWRRGNSLLSSTFIWSVTQLFWFFRDLKMANLLTGLETQQQPSLQYLTNVQSCLGRQIIHPAHTKVYFNEFVAKGQIISKGLFGILEFSPKTNERIRRSSKNEFVRSFFGRIRGYQKSFRNYLTFSFSGMF